LELSIVPAALVIESVGDSVRVRCPYCANIHTHGKPMAPDDDGERHAHCDSNEYYRITTARP